MREALEVGVQRMAADSAPLPVAALEEGRWRRQVRRQGWGGAVEGAGWEKIRERGREQWRIQKRTRGLNKKG
jgi:hypothetical protein